jgi:hypothetical protein
MIGAGIYIGDNAIVHAGSVIAALSLHQALSGQRMQQRPYTQLRLQELSKPDLV